MYIFEKVIGLNSKNVYSKESGQAILEFALIFPVFLLILFGIIDFGWIGYQRMSFEYGYIQSSWYISAGDLNDYDLLEDVPSENLYTGAIVADLLREGLENSSLGIMPKKLGVKNARATLYNKKEEFKVPGRNELGVLNEGYGITRYMDVNALIDYEIQPLTFVGRTFFGDNITFKKELNRTRIVSRQIRTE
ncbi:MAG: TadE family protein [Candidatus Alkaliphilus sp. MAG34]|nr:pilus assembly protein [Clostridiales bacterium]